MAVAFRSSMDMSELWRDAPATFHLRTINLVGNHMKLPRFQFGLRFFLTAVVVCALSLIFIWERANQPQVFRSNTNILGAVTYGDINALEELSLSPAEAMRSIDRDRARNVDLAKRISPDMLWECTEIEPLESSTRSPRLYPLIGAAMLRTRDFRCTVKGVDPKSGDEARAIVIVNRNHLHAVEID